MDQSLEAQKAHAEKEIYQLENRQKILLNRIRKEERNARTSRLCKHGAILEGVFPAVLDADGEAIKAFLIALSRLPGARELAEKTLNAGDAGYYSQYMRFMWEAPTGQPYLDLQAIIADKPVFVLTTNVDQQFFRVFPQKQICAFQGDFSYCQCSQPCRDDIWKNHELVKELTGSLVGVRLPEEAVPRCPDCGRVLVPWVRDDTFLEGSFWQDNLRRYHGFLRHWIMDQPDKKVLLLELGVGEMTPSIIKLPFWKLTAKNENVFYACLNREASHSPEHLRGRSLYLQGDLAEILAALRQERSIEAKVK